MKLIWFSAILLLPIGVEPIHAQDKMDKKSQCIFDYSMKLVNTEQTADSISYYVADKCLELSEPPLCRSIAGRCTKIDVEADERIRALTIDLVYNVISGWRRMRH